MALSSILNWLNPKARRAGKATEDLNTRKSAAHEGGSRSATAVPAHRTRHEGG